jgi:hypothetical protein
MNHVTAGICLAVGIAAAGARADIDDRLTALEKELATMRRQLTEQESRNKQLTEELEQIRRELVPASSVAAPIPATATQTMPPPDVVAEKAIDDTAPPKGEDDERGISVALLNGDSRLLISGDFNFMAMYSDRRPFVPGSPLYLLPLPSEGTSDFNGRQSRLNFAFMGPELAGWNVGGLATFGFQNNLTAEGYGFGPYVAYGEVRNDDWRFAAGLQYDILNPRDPKTIPNTLLAASGNAGAARNQIRVERFLHASEDWQATLQMGVSDPISTRIVDNSSILEDDGRPNLEGRLLIGLGESRELAGKRRARPVEVAVSGMHGGMRTLEGGANGALRQTSIDSWALGADTHLSITDRMGIVGEFFTGEGLGEYLGGIGQSYNRGTGAAISTTGGWGEFYAYLRDDLHIHLGYGIDTADTAQLGNGQMSRNETAYGTLVWDLSARLQMSFELDYRRTTYFRSGGDSLYDGLLYMSGVTWKF